MAKKYVVNYNAAPNSCGVDHRNEYDTINQVMCNTEEHMRGYYSAVRIFDTQLDDFVFWKDCMEKPWIDLLIRPEYHHRDLRTRDRKAH